jgi:hypothetical protein
MSFMVGAGKGGPPGDADLVRGGPDLRYRGVITCRKLRLSLRHDTGDNL